MRTSWGRCWKGGVTALVWVAVGGLPALGQELPVGHVGTLAEPIEAGSGGMEVDAEGNVYTADFGATLSRGPFGTRVWRITPAGEVSVFAEGLNGASGNAIDRNGVFFQSNIRSNTIVRIEEDGTLTPFVEEGLQAPVGLAFATNGDLMIANCASNTIGRAGPDGKMEVFASGGLLNCPNGLVTDGNDNFYASNFYNGDVVRIDSEGNMSRVASLPGNNNGHLLFAHDRLYVAGRTAHQIFSLSLDGEYEVLAGSGGHGVDDGPAMEATLSFPNDLALSPDGRFLYWNDVGAIVEDGGQTLSPTVVRVLRLRD